MKTSKIYLEELMDEIRTLSMDYRLVVEDGESFEIENTDAKHFSEDLLTTIKGFLAKNFASDEDTENENALMDDDEDDDDDLYMYVGEDDDDEEDDDDDDI